ncbi:hypothetical protein OKW11_000030 [Pseudomonas baetica]|nr:hypothetical protein [Pseudomonas baetica]
MRGLDVEKLNAAADIGIPQSHRIWPLRLIGKTLAYDFFRIL